MPPRAIIGIAAADIPEQAAENAKLNRREREDKQRGLD